MSDFLKYSALWRSAAGAGVAANSYPSKYSRGTLYVKCRNSAWSNELMLMSSRILEELHVAGAPEVERLVFKIVNFKNPLSPPAPAVFPERPPAPEELDRAEKLSSGTASPGLKEAIKKAYLAQKSAETREKTNK